eukprot:gene9348-12001_t
MKRMKRIKLDWKLKKEEIIAQLKQTLKETRMSPTAKESRSSPLTKDDAQATGDVAETNHVRASMQAVYNDRRRDAILYLSTVPLDTLEKYMNLSSKQVACWMQVARFTCRPEHPLTAVNFERLRSSLTYLTDPTFWEKEVSQAKSEIAARGGDENGAPEISWLREDTAAARAPHSSNEGRGEGRFQRPAKRSVSDRDGPTGATSRGPAGQQPSPYAPQIPPSTAPARGSWNRD